MTSSIRLMALSSLLALATSASAECAWVLWYEQSMAVSGEKGSYGWEVIGSYSSEVACEKEVARKVKSASTISPEEGATVKVQGNTVITTLKSTTGPTAVSIMRFVCLPDTVDPRGPKGKRAMISPLPFTFSLVRWALAFPVGGALLT